MECSSSETTGTYRRCCGKSDSTDIASVLRVVAELDCVDRAERDVLDPRYGHIVFACGSALQTDMKTFKVWCCSSRLRANIHGSDNLRDHSLQLAALVHRVSHRAHRAG